MWQIPASFHFLLCRLVSQVICGGGSHHHWLTLSVSPLLFSPFICCPDAKLSDVSAVVVFNRPVEQTKETRNSVNTRLSVRELTGPAEGRPEAPPPAPVQACQLRAAARVHSERCWPALSPPFCSLNSSRTKDSVISPLITRW